MNEFDKEEHTEDIWYSQIREILAESPKPLQIQMEHFLYRV